MKKLRQAYSIIALGLGAIAISQAAVAETTYHNVCLIKGHPKESDFKQSKQSCVDYSKTLEQIGTGVSCSCEPDAPSTLDMLKGWWAHVGKPTEDDLILDQAGVGQIRRIGRTLYCIGTPRIKPTDPNDKSLTHDECLELGSRSELGQNTQATTANGPTASRDAVFDRGVKPNYFEALTPGSEHDNVPSRSGSANI